MSGNPLFAAAGATRAAARTFVCTLAALLPLAGALAADYCVHPSGPRDFPSCNPVNGVCTQATSCTLASVNAKMTAGHRALLMAGNYGAQQIRPSHNGSADDSRVTYRAYGDGYVDLTWAGSGQSQDKGAISIANRRYITVSGKGVAGSSDARWLRLRPVERSGVQVNMCGAQYSIIEYTDVHCRSPATACSRLAHFCHPTSPEEASQDSAYNLVSNNRWQGYGVIDPDDRGAYTEDVLTSGDAPGITETHHNVIEGNIFLEAAHVVVRFSEWLNYANVIYGNYIGNDYHTALSLYQSGVGDPDDARHLVEYNFVRGSGEKTDLAQQNAGNTLQWGSAENIYRYNIFTEGNIMDAAKARNGAGTISGAAGISSDQVYKCARSRIYNNTVVYSGGPGWTCGVNQDSGGVPEAGDHFGLNKMVNNIFFDAYQYNVPWRQIEYSNSLYPTHDDVWVRNIFGQPGVDSLTNLIAIFGTMYTVDEARTSRTAHPGPVFADWATPQGTFRNEFKADLDTQDFVKYPGFPGTTKDYHLRAESTLIDSGAPLTQVSAVTSTTELVLDDARFFYAEAADFRDNAPWIGIQMDHICIGPDATDVAVSGTECVALAGIDDATSTVQLASPVTTRPGELVWLYRDSFGRRVVQGAAPDLGAAEFAATGPKACSPGTGELSWPFTFTLPTQEPGQVAACLDDTCSTRTACSQWTKNNCRAISGTSEYACVVVLKGLELDTPYWFEYSTATTGTRQTPAQGQPGRRFR